MKGQWVRLIGLGAGAMFVLVAVMAGWSVPVALIGGASAMLAGSVAGLILTRLSKDNETSDKRKRDQ